MRMTRAQLTTLALTTSLALTGATTAYASGSGGGGGGGGGGSVQSTSVDTITVTKAYTNATPDSGGEMLIKASSSDSSARLSAYRPDGTYIGAVQNGGGGRYGGTVMPYQFTYSATVTIRSSSGGSITVPTTPFRSDEGAQGATLQPAAEVRVPQLLSVPLSYLETSATCSVHLPATGLPAKAARRPP
jgi:hypothetical protein